MTKNNKNISFIQSFYKYPASKYKLHKKTNKYMKTAETFLTGGSEFFDDKVYVDTFA